MPAMMAGAVRVFVVDDHPMARQGVAVMLAESPLIRHVGEAEDGAQALRNAAAARPDVVIIDQSLPGMDGVATLAALAALLPQARCVLLLSEPDVALARRALAAGALGLLLKSATSQDLVAAVLAAARGQRADSPQIAAALADTDARAPLGTDLTRRERDLLQLLAQGLGNHEISTRLDIALPTVMFHVTNILSKLQAENRTAAVLVALRHQLVALGTQAGATA